MDRYEFLRAVLPSGGEGTYVAVFARQKIMWNVHYDTIEELADGCVEASKKGLTAYFALGTFLNNSELQSDGTSKTCRKASMAHEFKTLAIDVDCGVDKPYADAKAGLAALTQFVKNGHMPIPTVVSSGNGIHAYWALDKPIGRLEWREAGVSLRNACAKLGLVIDTSKVHDPAMVLRPLDTINHKGGNIVRLLLEKPATPAATLLPRIEAIAPAKVGKAYTPTPAQQMLDAILAATDDEWEPIIGDRVTAGCLQMAQLTTNGGEGYEPKWRLVCGMAKYAEHPEATVIKWSQGHAQYSESAAIAKMESWHADAVTAMQYIRQHQPRRMQQVPTPQQAKNTSKARQA